MSKSTNLNGLLMQNLIYWKNSNRQCKVPLDHCLKVSSDLNLTWKIRTKELITFKKLMSSTGVIASLRSINKMQKSKFWMTWVRHTWTSRRLSGNLQKIHLLTSNSQLLMWTTILHSEWDPENASLTSKSQKLPKTTEEGRDCKKEKQTRTIWNSRTNQMTNLPKWTMSTELCGTTIAMEAESGKKRTKKKVLKQVGSMLIEFLGIQANTHLWTKLCRGWRST